MGVIVIVITWPVTVIREVTGVGDHEDDVDEDGGGEGELVVRATGAMVVDDVEECVGVGEVEGELVEVVEDVG